MGLRKGVSFKICFRKRGVPGKGRGGGGVGGFQRWRKLWTNSDSLTILFYTKLFILFKLSKLSIYTYWAVCVNNMKFMTSVNRVQEPYQANCISLSETISRDTFL